LRSRLSFFW